MWGSAKLKTGESVLLSAFEIAHEIAQPVSAATQPHKGPCIANCHHRLLLGFKLG